MRELFVETAAIISMLVIGSGLLQSVISLMQLATAAHVLRKQGVLAESAVLWARYENIAPALSFMVPAFDEEITVCESVRSLLALRYPRFEVIVVNDGSRDETLKALNQAFNLHVTDRSHELVISCAKIRGLYASATEPRLLVVDKENGGKADALNAAVNFSRGDLVCTVDADSLLDDDALLRAVRPFINDPERVMAVGGCIRVANGCEIRDGKICSVRPPSNFWALMQATEYLRAFLLARIAWSEWGALTIISGAFGLFQAEAVEAVGGYSSNTVGEDMELVVKLHAHFRKLKQPYRIVFQPEAVCWTEVPESLKFLGRQRARWHRGALETFVSHRNLLFNPEYGRIGFVAFGYILLVDILDPVIQFAGYFLIPIFWLLGLIQWNYFLAYLAITFIYGIAISLGAIWLDDKELRRYPDVRSVVILMFAAVVENFGYRQFNTIWRVRGTWQFLTRQQSWGAMTRRGF